MSTCEAYQFGHGLAKFPKGDQVLVVASCEALVVCAAELGAGDLASADHLEVFVLYDWS